MDIDTLAELPNAIADGLLPGLLGDFLDTVTPALGPTDIALGTPLDITPILSLFGNDSGLGGGDEDLSSLVEIADGILEQVRDAGALLLDTTPVVATPLEIPSLIDAVTVERDRAGVVHIDAENNSDLFTALGFVHASDRLWQMDFQRRLAAGTLSEVAGAEALEQDVFQRTLGLTEAAESAYAALDDETRQVIGEYTAGINAYLGLGQPLPLEFQLLDYEPEPWRPVDIVAGVKLRSLGLSTNYQTELFRTQQLSQGLSFERIQELFPSYTGDETVLQPEDIAVLPLESTMVLPLESTMALPLEDTAALPESDPLADLALTLEGLEAAGDRLLPSQALFGSTLASNNWVVSGDRTTTGLPFLANDPHISMQIPSVWHLVSLESPDYSVVGASIPGSPGVAIGRNDRIAWGVTNTQADVQDLYALAEVDPGVSYLFNGEAVDYQTRTETIAVRGQDPVSVTVRESVQGPVISDALGTSSIGGDGVPLALRWTSLAPEDPTLTAFLGINQAQNWDEFRTALQDYIAPSQNFVYADVEGNIGYLAPGQLPIRAEGFDGLLPAPGTGEAEWQGFIPFDQLPQTFNPERGYIISANNRIAPDDYPYPISFEWAEPFRAQRIRELIERDDELSLEDMQAIQLDQRSLLFESFKPVLQQIEPLLEAMTPRPEAALDWLDRLLVWNGNMNANLQRPTVFQTWYTELTRLPAAAIGEELLQGNLTEPAPRFLLNALTQGDPVCGSAEDCLQSAAQTFVEVVDSFEGRVPRWGDVHQATFSHPALPLERQVPFGGDRYTVNVGTYDPETFLMDDNGPTYRQIVDLSNPEDSLFMTTPGQSGSLTSPFFDNLLEPWQQGEYLPMGEAIDVALTLELVPTGSSGVAGLGSESVSFEAETLALVTDSGLLAV
ncbi:MAG: penicillin acylase family protein [Elainellaceae cyanobacterium]